MITRGLPGAALMLGIALALCACGRNEQAGASATLSVVRPALPVELVPAPDIDEVAPFLQGEVQRAKWDGRDLVVVVGAAWCEPCRRFHAAVKAGALNEAFPALRLIEFDLDRDQNRLARAGYSSGMIPLFALPRPDGSASGEQIQGSIKGRGAVDQITPRLRALIEKGRAGNR